MEIADKTAAKAMAEQAMRTQSVSQNGATCEASLLKALASDEVGVHNDSASSQPWR